MKPGFNIGRHMVGEGHPVFIVAELSANHLRKFDTAVNTIKAMKRAGADAVKFQAFTPETITIDSNEKYFKIKGKSLWHGKTLFELYKEASAPLEWLPELKKIARKIGLECFSSAFDKYTADYLEKMGVSAYKIASLEITDHYLIDHVARKGKPVIISTGIAKKADIQKAVTICKNAGNMRIALLKCTSVYPTPFDQVNLLNMPRLKKDFGTVIGLSDHTLGISVAIAAVALGAKIIEKHFILHRKNGGLDERFSLEPWEFKKMADSIRQIEKAKGSARYGLTAGAKESRSFCRSLFFVDNILKGQTITEKTVRSVRPGYGLAPKFLRHVLGRKVSKDVKKGTPVSWGLLR